MSAALPTECFARLDALLATGQRRILGLVGSPGAGKSTLADTLADARPGQTVVVPMDGFHLANAELARLDRAERKGAPDTFDAWGYAALLQRLRSPAPGEIVYAPAFRREIEEPVAGVIPVPADVPLVITEGNYLLIGQGAWGRVRALLDEVWFLDVDPVLRRRRLLDRHIVFGRSAEEAAAWVSATDDPNAERIDATRGGADFVVTLGT